MEKPEVSNKKLIAYLKEIDELLEEDIKIIAVGGTAMTLLKIKTSTIDVDFELINDDHKIFSNVKELVPTGFYVDIFKNGFIFSQQLPMDHLDHSIEIKTQFKHISLYALHPMDIVASKIPRLYDRDLEDIRMCIDKYKLKKKDIEKRTKQVEYACNEKDFRTNLKYVLENCF